MRSVSVAAMGHPHYRCTLERLRCFPTRDDLAAGYTPADFFTHVAFVDPACGDCSASLSRPLLPLLIRCAVLTALVAESGELGLGAVLPDAPEVNSTLATTFAEPPHLPLVSEWADGDFSLASVLPPGADARAFSVQLLHRYRYVIGAPPPPSPSQV